MDAENEIRILNMVFGASTVLKVTKTERPDFVCAVLNTLVFGVEVAEFFLSESAARLRRIPDYAHEILSAGNYRHKDDRIRLPVETVTYTSAATGESRQIRAIVGESHTADTKIERLSALVDTKNSKYSDYSSTVRPIDLIIHDADNLMQFDDLAEIIRPISRSTARDCVRRSEFREIYLVTRKGHEKVCIPLRANLFVAELYAFQRLFRDFYGEKLRELTERKYIEDWARYITDEFPNTEYDIDKEGLMRVMCTSVACGYTKAGLRVVDISCEARRDRKKLADEVEGDLDHDLREYIETKRPRLFCMVPIFVAAHSDEKQSVVS